jgi:hypothetical protein
LLFRDKPVDDALLRLLQRLRDADLLVDVNTDFLLGRPPVRVL